MNPGDLFNIISITDNEDGGATVVVDMSPEVLLIFAKIGFLKVVCDAALEMAKKENSGEGTQETNDD